MSRKSEETTVIAIASYHPIGKVEAADCIRERGDDDDNHDSTKDFFFPLSLIRGR